MGNENGLKDAYVKVLLSSAMQPENPQWSEKLCWVFFENADIELQKLSIVCLGHIARIAKDLTAESIERLKMLENESVVSAEASNALEDFEIFSSRSL